MASWEALFPKKPFFEPAVKVWVAESIKTFPNQYNGVSKAGYLSLPITHGTSMYGAHQISLSLSILAVLLFIAGAIFIGRDLYGLIKIKKNSHLIRRLGQVSIYVHDFISVPFSYWTPWKANVMIPSTLLSKPHDFRIALKHELQHHRQKDTQWVYGIWLTRMICILNPLIHLWSKQLSEIQEFACDETLVDHKKVESQQYARCPIEVAETAINQKQVPACATGLMFLIERNLLKRRIVKMTTYQKQMKKSISGWIGVFILALMTATAFASQGLVQDKRITLEDAKKLAEKANLSTRFPIVINDLVLKQLNRFIGTPEGREFIKNSITRMENHKRLIDGKINSYDLPPELAAIPMIESGYQNLPESGLKGHGAGLWMFIVSTAKNYGLSVNDKVDERLNIDLETDAAMRYLKSNYLRFKDWPLAVLAYNIGEKNVMKAIQQTGSHDAWALIRNGHEGDKDYLPKVIASMIILKNPETMN